MVKCGNCGHEPGLLHTWELTVIKNSGCPSCKTRGQWVPMDDPINSPPYYIFGEYEVIDILRAWIAANEVSGYESFLWASMQQYLFRYKKKRGNEDLKKAEFYLRRLVKENDG